MANERHTDVREWEVDSSTRQSVHPYNKYEPFREATSTTAATLKTIAVGEIATNSQLLVQQFQEVLHNNLLEQHHF